MHVRNSSILTDSGIKPDRLHSVGYQIDDAENPNRDDLCLDPQETRSVSALSLPNRNIWRGLWCQVIQV